MALSVLSSRAPVIQESTAKQPQQEGVTTELACSADRFGSVSGFAVGFDDPPVRALDMALYDLQSRSPLTLPQDLQQVLMVLQPGLRKVVPERTTVHEVDENLRAQSEPGLVEPLVVSTMEDGVMEGDVQAGDRRPRERARQVVELLQQIRHMVEIGVGAVPAEPLDSKPFESFPQAVKLVHAVGAQLRHRGTTVALDVNQTFLSEQDKSLSDRSAAHVEVGSQVLFDQALTEVYVATEDGAPDGVRDLVGQDPPTRQPH